MLVARILRRSLHTAPTNYVRRKANPGIGIQTQVFKREGIVEKEEDYEDFEDMQSDFMDLHKTHKQHDDEMSEYRDQMRRWVVKNKYFKQKLPNFLTYMEKEQIKLLNSRDPEEWTVEKLAESFPANLEIIKKIVRTKWVPRSAKRIKQHDEAVMENWQNFKKGEFPQLEPQLKEHLTKFSSRKKVDLENLLSNWNPKTPLPRPKRTDFLSMITSCKGYADKELPQYKMLTDAKAKELTRLPTTDDEETYITNKIKDKRNMRLEELKRLKLKDQQNDVVFENPSGTGVVPTENPFALQRYASDEIVVSQEDMKKYEMSKVKDKIYIPRKLRQKGATYKVDDCYYDDDGEFLYRVPGMTGRTI